MEYSTELVDSMLAYGVDGTSSNLTTAQASNPLPPALCCWYEGWPEGQPAVYMLIQCTPHCWKRGM